MMFGCRVVGEGGLGSVTRRASWVAPDLEPRFPESPDVEKRLALPLRSLNVRELEAFGARVRPVIEGGVRPRVVGLVRVIVDPCKLGVLKPDRLGVRITDGAGRGALMALRLGT